MNTLLKKITVVILLTLLMSNVFAAKKQKAPAWMSDIHAEYPYNEYIAQIGQGSSEALAQNDAVAQIARFIESDVNTTTNSLLTMSSNDSEVIKNSFVNVATTVSSNVKLFQVQHSASYYDKKAKTYYVVAYINRNDAFEIFKSKIDVPANQIKSYCNSAEEEADDFRKGLLLNNALFFSSEFIEKYCFATMLYPAAAKKYDSVYQKVLNLPSQIKTIFSKCSITVLVDDDLNFGIESKLKTILSGAGFPVLLKGGLYKINVNVNMDIQSTETGYFYYPSFQASVEGDNGVVGSFGQTGKKIAAKNPEVAQKRAYQEIQNILEDAFYSQFLIK